MFTSRASDHDELRITTIKQHIESLDYTFKLINHRDSVAAEETRISIQAECARALDTFQQTKNTICQIVGDANEVAQHDKENLNHTISHSNDRLNVLSTNHNDLMKESIQKLKLLDNQLKNDGISNLINESIILINSLHIHPTTLKLPDYLLTMTADSLHVASTTESGSYYGRSQATAPLNQKLADFNHPNKLGKRSVGLFKDKKGYNFGATSAYLNVSDFDIPDGEVVQSSQQIISVANNKNSSMLRDRILNHKNSAVKHFIEHIYNDGNERSNHFTIDKNQIEAEYPCLIIQFKNYDYTQKNGGFKEGYQAFVTHLLIACINNYLKANNITPFIEKRESFGFLTPTLSDIDSGLRLSFGLVPHHSWLECVKLGIERCDHLLESLDNKLTYKSFSTNNIMTSKGHHLIQEIIESDDESISYNLAELSNKDMASEFNVTDIKDNLERLKKDNYSSPASNIELTNEYKSLHNECMLVYQAMATSLGTTIHARADNTDALKKSQNEILESLVKTINPSQFDNYNTSDDEDTIEQHTESSLSFRTPSGMSSLFAPAKALHDSTNDPQNPSITYYDYDDYAYFELALSWKNSLNLPFCSLNNVRDEIRNQFSYEIKSCVDKAQETTTISVVNNLENFNNKMISQYGTEYYFHGDHDDAQLYYLNAFDNSKVYDSSHLVPITITDINKISSLFESNTAYKKKKSSLNPDNFAHCITQNGGHQKPDKSGEIQSFLAYYEELFHARVIEIINRYLNQNTDMFIQSCKRDMTKLLNTLKVDYKTKSKTTGPLKNYLDKLFNPTFDIFKKVYDESILLKLKATLEDKTASIYYYNVNPCMNNKNISYRPFKAVLDELTAEGKEPPKVLVIDTTSTTQDKLHEIIQQFDTQDKIPLLVTATSMLKHNELGLDAYLLGENKVYLSKEAAKEDKNREFFLTYTENLKAYTKGTESGFSRFSRRLLRDSINSVTRSPDSLFYHKNIKQFGNDEHINLTIEFFTLALEKSVTNELISANINNSNFNNPDSPYPLSTILHGYYLAYPDIFKKSLNELLHDDMYRKLRKEDFDHCGFSSLGNLVQHRRRDTLSMKI